jgi:predicted transposase/invertase (TIGR01784 family)
VSINPTIEFANRIISFAGERGRSDRFSVGGLLNLELRELTQHPKDRALYSNIEELLTNYRAILEQRRKLTPEDEELIMNLSAAYLQKQQEWKEEGIQTGIHQVAIAMLQENLDLQLIAKTTGLPIKAVKQLQKENSLS